MKQFCLRQENKYIKVLGTLHKLIKGPSHKKESIETPLRDKECQLHFQTKIGE